MKEAVFFKKLKSKIVQCTACNRFCLIKEGKVGKCGVRKNVEGKLMLLVYGKTLTTTIDPIEKKPLFHFKPATFCLGVSTFGCNFFCLHCQNYHMSQVRDEKEIEKLHEMLPEELVAIAKEEGIEGIAYTYNEPTIFVEYALDTMKLAKEKRLYNVWVSNGYMSQEVVEAIAPFLNAINIDLKGNQKFYEKVCGNARVDFVKENIKRFHDKKVHVEVTNLIVPGFNDSEKDFKEVSDFIHSIDSLMPLHFTRFFPHYKMNYLPPTDIAKLQKAKEIAEKSGLKYVFIGNVLEEDNSYCPKCGNLLIARVGYSTNVLGLDSEAKCKQCGFNSKIVL